MFSLPLFLPTDITCVCPLQVFLLSFSHTKIKRIPLSSFIIKTEIYTPDTPIYQSLLSTSFFIFSCIFIILLFVSAFHTFFSFLFENYLCLPFLFYFFSFHTFFSLLFENYLCSSFLILYFFVYSCPLTSILSILHVPIFLSPLTLLLPLYILLFYISPLTSHSPVITEFSVVCVTPLSLVLISPLHP
uniref:Uncharacterized protein n=1 Tax=Cacopsylla melanoneura TaxID=428564 RepID=A0A8D8TKN9_9HEMI